MCLTNGATCNGNPCTTRDCCTNGTSGGTRLAYGTACGPARSNAHCCCGTCGHPCHLRNEQTPRIDAEKICSAGRCVECSLQDPFVRACRTAAAADSPSVRAYSSAINALRQARLVHNANARNHKRGDHHRQEGVRRKPSEQCEGTRAGQVTRPRPTHVGRRRVMGSIAPDRLSLESSMS